MKRTKVIIAGAGGRDFHNFLVYFKENPLYEVVCFTAEQIPGIEKRVFPKQLAGKLYSADIPIYPEKDLERLIKKFKIDEVILSYSDLSFDYVGNFFSRVLSAGANFKLLGPDATMLHSSKPVVAVCAVRTGSGKSQTSRQVLRLLSAKGLKVAVVRHPMPYGNLLKQEVQKFCSYSDFIKHKATMEEQEEYTKYIEMGHCVYAGVDYKKILRLAEKESDVILWDGGNNDFPFYKPDLLITVTDPHRPGHEVLYYPGEICFRMAGVIVINKVDSAKKENVSIIEENIRKHNPSAFVIKAASAISVDKPNLIKGKTCIIIGDGPTLTHGNMPFSAGTLAVKKYGGKIADPRRSAVGSIKKVFEKYPHLKNELPAMGYSKRQLLELQKTTENSDADIVVDATPANLMKILKIRKPMVVVEYELEEIGAKNLNRVLDNWLRKLKLG